MSRHFKIMRSKWLVLTALILAALLLFPEAALSKTPEERDSASLAGPQIFASRCAACHGLDGSGTQRAPSIVANSEAQKLSRKELFQVVSRGVPGAGMPSFRSLGTKGIDAVTSYLRLLQGNSGSARLPGDRRRGEAVFFGKGGCSNCHMAAGRGGFIAPDLTTYGQAHSAEQVRTAITNPGVREAPNNMVTAITADGERYEGIIRNEDNFSLQLQSMDGVFYFLSKSDLKSLDRTKSIMPADYSSSLSPAELDDVVNYLQAIAKAAPRAESRRRNRE